MTKAKIVTFDSRSELKSWFDLRGDEDRAIIFSHRENLPNNMVKYESIITTRQGTQRIPEKATSVVKRFLERYTGTLGITTKLADGIQKTLSVGTTDATGTIVPSKPPSFATKIILHLKEYGRARDTASINRAIGYTGPGLGSIYTNLTNSGKIVRLSRGYYIHPDYHNRPLQPIKEAIDRPAANGSEPFAHTHRLVIHEDPPKPVLPPVQGHPSDDQVLEWLGAMAVRYASPELFASTMDAKAIVARLRGEPVPSKPVVAEAPEPPVAALQAAPEAILTERQLDFGAYLEDKTHRDVSPKELVENVLKMEYSQRHRYIYDTDMLPHGWYRTREDNANMWRHESRRRTRRSVARR